MKNWRLARRDLLKRLGVGAACLPLLSATRARGAAAPRKRLLIVQTGQGYRQPYWRPAVGALAGQTLPDSCAPLERRKNDLIFLPDLTNPIVGAVGDGAYGVTFYGLGPSTGAGRYREPSGMTLDQVVGTALRTAGQRVSLNLGVQLDRPPKATTAPGGNYCFWAGAGMPIRPILDPTAVYEEIIAVTPSDPAAAKRLMVRRKSILDYVGSNLEEYGKRLGTDDRAAVESHMQSVRDLEGQLQALAAGPACEPGPPGETLDLLAGENYGKILTAHLGLMVITLKCGITNVATLQTSDASGKNIHVSAFIPGLPADGTGYKSSPGSLREFAHNPVQGGTDWKRIIDRWFMARFAGLLDQLATTIEEGRSMLDSTVVLIGNHVQEGANHDAQKLPWMLAGNCGGYFDTGRCLASAGRPIAGVMAAICEALGVSHGYGAAMPMLKKV
jgi:hypothetical protein